MYIQCTQKLLAKLRMPHGELSNPPASQYCWHANFFEYHGLAYVVMMNDQTGKELFFPVDSFQDFAQQVEIEVELDMEDMGASVKEVSTYMRQAGPLAFGPTSDHSAIAQLSGYTKRMKNLLDKMHDLKAILEDESELDALAAHVNEAIETLAESQKKKKNKPRSNPK